MVVVDALIKQRAQQVVDLVSRYGRVHAAFLFGSHANGTADQDSDIDIAAFVEALESWDLRKRVRVIVEAQKALGDDVELHLFPADSIDNPLPASFAAYVQKHGVRIEI